MSDSTYLVRLKPYDPRRGHVIRRYTYRGIKFQEERGWYRVDKAVADHLRSVRQFPADPHSQPAFDVHTPTEAKAIDQKEHEAETVRKQASESLELSRARDSVDGATPPESSRPGEGSSESKPASAKQQSSNQRSSK